MMIFLKKRSGGYAHTCIDSMKLKHTYYWKIKQNAPFSIFFPRISCLDIGAMMAVNQNSKKNSHSGNSEVLNDYHLPDDFKR